MDPAAQWGDAEFTQKLARVTWMASPAVRGHLNERATGHPLIDWITGWAAGYAIGRNLNVLVLGCGEGWLERSIAPAEAIGHIDAMDVAADAIERARIAASDIPKISYAVADMNRDTLTANRYDVVIAHSILHHVENLEHAFPEIERSMKRDAVLIVNEYVGPKRFQYSQAVHDMINRLLVALPSRLRRGLIDPRLYERKERPTNEEMIANDPSEAVRSDELRAFIAKHFDVLDERKIGGTILQHLLYDIVQNFDVEKPRERAMLEILCEFEAALVDSGAIPCDFMNIAARRRDCMIPSSAYRMPPTPRRLGAHLFDSDPLGFGPRTPVPEGKDSGSIPEWMIRVLRAVLLSRLESRRPLVRDSAIRRLLEQGRYRWSRAASADDWLLARYRAVADRSDEDDRAIEVMLETIVDIARGCRKYGFRL